MDETHWQRHLLVGLLALAVGTALIGGVGGVLTLRAAELVGIGSPTQTTTEEPSRPWPKPRAPRANEAAQPERATTPRPRTGPARPRHAAHRAITLKASPSSAVPYERVYLTGTYQGAGGAGLLQVQRLEGKTWVNFLASTSVDGRAFSTYIQTESAGVNRFRVQDNLGRASNVVTVTIN